MFLAFAAGIAACFYIGAQGKLTEREASLFNIMIATLSILASWIFTDMYAGTQARAMIHDVKEEYTANLRTYGLKAAEKVNNLSNELNKLAIYLEEELSYTDYRSTEEELLAKEERIESAIHLIRALKSINDTGLSDWEGVIGEELDQQREEKEEREEILRDIMSRVEAAIENKGGDRPSQDKYGKMTSEIHDLQKELRLALSQLSGTSIPKRARKKEPKQNIEGKCPACGCAVTYKQRSSSRSFKVVACSGCGIKLVGTYSASGGFTLKPRIDENVEIQCPICEKNNSVTLNNLPTSHVSLACGGCGNELKIIRTIDGIDARRAAVAEPGTLIASRVGISEDIVERVGSALPAQPWPTGVHRAVASELGIPAATVQRAIQELIRRGRAFPQIDGLLYQPARPQGGEASGAP